MQHTDPNGPADTRLMGLIHGALRRDLGRSHPALPAVPPPAPPQRRPTAAHLARMMQSLHAHHEPEDGGLYPLVRERLPEAADLLDSMHPDHEAIAGGIVAVEARARDYG